LYGLYFTKLYFNCTAFCFFLYTGYAFYCVFFDRLSSATTKV